MKLIKNNIGKILLSLVFAVLIFYMLKLGVDIYMIPINLYVR